MEHHGHGHLVTILHRFILGKGSRDHFGSGAIKGKSMIQNDSDCRLFKKVQYLIDGCIGLKTVRI